MTFPEMAVMTCVASFKAGRVSQYEMRNILRCTSVNVSPIIPFLKSPNNEVRYAAVQIVGEKGDADLLVELVVDEKETEILFCILKCLGKRGKNLEPLYFLLESPDTVLRQEAIAMFRRAGKTDILFPLLFDEDTQIVDQVRDYMNERERKSSKKSCSQG